ncbi:lipase, putative [Bodo saltans]|uniref:Lipase, putative n=1 Tax=Bodo saltans TaxID=75058 RepID=A0A0S4KKM2_BODSA|nr:lipase, putative [Bodo saltans]|eukprot:CUI15143.1 lipase, putative [Bodo saltans]
MKRGGTRSYCAVILSSSYSAKEKEFLHMNISSASYMLITTVAVLIALAAHSASAAAASSISVDNVVVTGRSAVVPDPINASWNALAFDFNGVSLNATVSSSASIQRIQVGLTTACYQLSNGSWSKTSHAGHRFRLYTSPVGDSGAWTAPAGNVLVDTHDAACNQLQWFDLFEGSMTAPVQFSLFHLTEADWNAWNATQPNFILFHEFRVYSGQQEAATVSKAELTHTFRVGQSIIRRSSQDRRRRIEFIGDSITAGYCNTCNLFPNASNTYAQEDFSLSWARLTCGLLNADCHTEAWSGRGVIRNCDDSAPIWMPTIVRRAVGSVSEFDNFWGVENTWDLSSFVPDALVVNLGTNDYGCHPIPNITQFNAEFEQAYVGMLTDLLVGYHNATQGVFIACGPMSSAYCDAVHSIIAKMHQLGYPGVYFLNHVGLLPQSEQCCGHPDTVADGTIAGVTVSTIRSTLGWV